MTRIVIRRSTGAVYCAGGRLPSALLLIGATVVLAAGAGAGQASVSGVHTGAVTANAATVKITLGTKTNEFVLVPSVRTIPSGRVTFVVHNGGRLEHEFVVLRTNVPAAKLPMRPGGKQAKEPGAIGEIEEFNPGLTKRLTLKVGQGHYVLLCNMPLHYKKGGFSDFKVK